MHSFNIAITYPPCFRRLVAFDYSYHIEADIDLSKLSISFSYMSLDNHFYMCSKFQIKNRMTSFQILVAAKQVKTWIWLNDGPFYSTYISNWVHCVIDEKWVQSGISQYASFISQSMTTSSNGKFSALLALGNSPHKGQWYGTLMLSLICAWINGSVNNREAGDLRRIALIMTSL